MLLAKFLYVVFLKVDLHPKWKVAVILFLLLASNIFAAQQMLVFFHLCLYFENECLNMLYFYFSWNKQAILFKN